MSAGLELHPGERLLFRASVSLIGKQVISRVGTCYLTDQRIIVESVNLVAGVFGILSAIARFILNRFGPQPQHQEIALRDLREVTLQRYGLNHSVNIPLYDGSQMRMVFSGGTRQRFFATLDQALRAQGRQRVEVGPNAWRIRPIM